MQVTDESVKLEASERPSAHSPLFDGKRIKLRAVRGETLGLQVLLGKKHNQRVELRLQAKGVGVQGFAVHFSHVREPSSEMYGPSRGAGHYPDLLKPARQPLLTSRQAFFDVAIAHEAIPGEVRGALQVGDKSYPVELRIERASVDLSRNPLVWVYYDPKEIARVHGLPDDDGPRQLATEERYHALFREHGAYLAADLPPERFSRRRKFVDNVRYWPVGFDRQNPASVGETVTAWLEQFADLQATPFIITVDEPSSMPQKRRALQIAHAIERAGGGRPKLLRAVTDTAEPVYGNAFDLYFSPHNIPKLAGQRRDQGELFFTYNGRPPQAGSMIIDTDGLALRTWGWIAYRYDLELWYAWEGLYFSDRYNDGKPTDVLGDPVTFDERTRRGEDWGNGDGLLAYPGPFPSLRLKALRRGLLDRLLLMRLEACGGQREAQNIVKAMIPRALGEARAAPAWPLEPARWEAGRHQLLDSIARRCSS